MIALELIYFEYIVINWDPPLVPIQLDAVQVLETA